MAWRGTDNLRFYLGKAVLPQMPLGVGAPEIPPEGHKSHHNTLTVRPEPYRKLQSIYQLQDRHFDNLVLDCEPFNSSPSTYFLTRESIRD